MRRTALWLAALTLAMACPFAGADAPPRAVGNFRLVDTKGAAWTLDGLKDKKAIVVVFLGTQCPINNAYAPRLVELQRTYADRGVQFLAINANDHDTPEAIGAHARKYKLSFPVLRDERHVVADQFGAERTPEAFVLDAQRTIRYRGRIDDQFGIGYQRNKATTHDLTDALDAVLAGKAVARSRTSVAGCIIARAPRPRGEATVTFAKDISRIVQKNCQECHRPGQVGPMPLLTYNDVASWAAMIREVVDEGRMPPWHADPKHGKFRNDRSLSKAERTKLLAWIDQGCPRGDDRDLPAPKQYPKGWTIGTPDTVLTMKEFKVPAKAGKGGIPYKYMRLPTNFEQDVWVRAAEIKPGNRAVVHHVIAYVFEKGRKRREAADGFGAGMLVAYAPGDLGVSFPPGAAKKIPKGATIVFQMHYTPTGKEEIDRTSIGLVLTREAPQHEVRTRAVAQQLMLIPPGADNHEVRSASTFKKDAILYSLFPHMHLRGKNFEFRAVFPDGRKDVLLSVPRYDFNWQANYHLKEPLRLPAGTRIECIAHYDNSAKNPNNPDPTRWVHWGEQTWDEMLVGFLDYTYVEAAQKK